MGKLLGLGEKGPGLLLTLRVSTECLLSVVCRPFLYPGPFAGIKLSPSLQPASQLLSESSFKKRFIFIYLLDCAES